MKTSSVAEKGSDVRHRQYCTQACLLGLVRGRPLDHTCPNANTYRVHGAGSHHAIEQKSLARLIIRQLAENPDGCEPLGKQGSRSALFRLTLESHEYTFVAKGTVMAFEAELMRESLVYQRLDDVQGELVPVYLGNIPLIRPYFLDFNVRIIHMLLMSWAVGQDMAIETRRAERRILGYSVKHGDVRPVNILWNAETQNVMLVSFERSEILNQKPILHEISPNRE
ncbi:hypothetical protein F5884DRAFT_839745 [Xylogone sp. PMI_703]|nr:hypothetical protein F5884DRAFT_839745 [Xylogone sp. PMI_703]